MNGHNSDGLAEAVFQARIAFELDVIHALQNLPIPITISPSTNGAYHWYASDGQGIAHSLTSAVSQSISFLLGRVSSASAVDILRKEKQRRIDEGESPEK